MVVVIAGSYFLLKMKFNAFGSKESGVALCFGVSLLLPKAMYSCPFSLDILILLVDDPGEALIKPCKCSIQALNLCGLRHSSMPPSTGKVLQCNGRGRSTYSYEIDLSFEIKNKNQIPFK